MEKLPLVLVVDVSGNEFRVRPRRHPEVLAFLRAVSATRLAFQKSAEEPLAAVQEVPSPLPSAPAPALPTKPIAGTPIGGIWFIAWFLWLSFAAPFFFGKGSVGLALVILLLGLVLFIPFFLTIANRFR